MNKILTFFVVSMLLFSCKKELVKAPNNLIEKDKMVNIMYDLSLLEAIKVQNPSAIDSFNLNSKEFILKKYKTDSLQFAMSNVYYAADYKEYKKMYEQIKTKLDKNKTFLDSVVKVKRKKDSIIAKTKEKLKLKKIADSIKKAKNELKIEKRKDSIKKVTALKTAKLLESPKKPKKKKPVL